MIAGTRKTVTDTKSADPRKYVLLIGYFRGIKILIMRVFKTSYVSLC
jgi:hypothetical protein